MPDGFDLAPLLDTDEAVVIRVRHELEPHAQRLLVSLGAGWIVDPAHGERCVERCGHPECANNEEDLMDEAAHTATQSRSCKIPGCPHEAVARLGKFAGLCSDHIDVRRRSGVDAPASNGAAAPRTPRSSGPSGLAEKVATLGTVENHTRAPQRPPEGDRVTRELRDHKTQVVRGGLTTSGHKPVRVLPDWIGYRSSLANVDRRQARGETVIECPACECEVDVTAPAHSPKCGAAT